MPKSVPNFILIDPVVVENEADKRGRTYRQTDRYSPKQVIK